jgi:LruC domain-containing protein
MFETIVIAATAVVVNGSNEETVWAGNITGGALSEYTIGFNDNSWPYLFYFTPESCVYNFAWEDKKTSDNDQDYNDIIIKSHTERNGNDYSLKFRVVARGASYNHDFKIRLLKTDVANSSDITGAIEVADSTNFWEVLIFENTYDDPNLAGEGDETVYNTNTCSTSGLVAERTITVKNSTLTGNDLVPPFDPILFVDKNKEDGLDINEYYLNIWEIHAYSGNNGLKWFDSKGDTYAIDGKNYPNGIMIPQAWKWPKEKFQINGAYTRFSDINSWKPDWYSKEVVENGLMDCDVD